MAAESATFAPTTPAEEGCTTHPQRTRLHPSAYTPAAHHQTRAAAPRGRPRPAASPRHPPCHAARCTAWRRPRSARAPPPARAAAPAPEGNTGRGLRPAAGAPPTAPARVPSWR
eukprot:scaffold4211_cov112-Isochrysis_galbana.AAC.2